VEKNHETSYKSKQGRRPTRKNADRPRSELGGEGLLVGGGGGRGHADRVISVGIIPCI